MKKPQRAVDGHVPLKLSGTRGAREVEDAQEALVAEVDAAEAEVLRELRA